MEKSISQEKVLECVFNELFNDRLSRVLLALFSGISGTYICITDRPASEAVGNIFCKVFEPTLVRESPDLLISPDGTDCWGKPPYCCVCKESRSKDPESYVMLKVKHWIHLCAVLGLNRWDLPPYSKNYRSRFSQSSFDKPLLNNANPGLFINEEISAKYRNDYKIGIRICPECISKLKKQYGRYEKSVLIYSRKSYAIIDTVGLDVFLKSNPGMRKLNMNWF